jgi:hypothetical protein
MSFDFGGLVKTLENEIIGGASEQQQAGPIIKRKKLFLVSTDINQPTGYAKVSHQIIQQLASKSWLDIVHFAIQHLQDGTTGRTYPATQNLKIYNAVELEKQANTGFAIKELPQILAKEQPDVLLIYNDSAVISAYLEEIRKSDF